MSSDIYVLAACFDDYKTLLSWATALPGTRYSITLWRYRRHDYRHFTGYWRADEFACGMRRFKNGNAVARREASRKEARLALVEYLH